MNYIFDFFFRAQPSQFGSLNFQNLPWAKRAPDRVVTQLLLWDFGSQCLPHFGKLHPGAEGMGLKGSLAAEIRGFHGFHTSIW